MLHKIEHKVDQKIRFSLKNFGIEVIKDNYVLCLE